MNERFLALPQDKQKAMIDAGLSVFSTNDYRQASVDEVARRASVSKALIFHYFGSKRELYLYLYRYATKAVIEGMSATHDYSETDFFRILENAQRAKIAILHRHPDVMRFITKAYFEESPEVKDELDKRFASIVTDSGERFLKRVDASKLKPDVSPKDALNIVLWMSEGYMRSRTPEQLENLDALNEEFLRMMSILRKQFYKEDANE